MSFTDNNNYLKVLSEIIIKKDRELYEEIQQLPWTAVTNQEALAKNLMERIRNKLTEWGIDILSFVNVTSKENELSTMFYLIETIKSDDDLYEYDQIRSIKDIIHKDLRSPENIHDCLESIPDLLKELKQRILAYNATIERRIHLYKSLKEFACQLFDIFCSVKKKLNNFHLDGLEHYADVLMDYVKQLLNMSFVITAYPPRTIKKGTENKVGTHFKTTINCLIETEKLFCRESSIQPYFLTEADFREYILTKQLKKDCLIKFKPNNIKLNVWELNGMLWIPPKRLQKEGRKSERITNKKAIILIILKAFVNPCFFGLFEVNATLYSDTVVSIVHTNQEVDAHMTLFWDDYFRIERSAFLHDGMFQCKEAVTIQELVEAVSRYFAKETSRGLTPSNVEFLNRKLFRTVANGLMSLTQFSSQPMPDSDISFGSWVISLIKLLKIPGICELWKGQLIDGFMAKEVESLFAACKPGTFALRFSEKSPKIGVLLKTPDNSIEAWNPFSADECRIRNLCERLMEFHELQMLRNANGIIVDKETELSNHIANKQPDVGYTERGQLSRILLSNIYTDPLDVFGDDIDDMMDADPFLGDDMDEEFHD